MERPQNALTAGNHFASRTIAWSVGAALMEISSATNSAPTMRKKLRSNSGQERVERTLHRRMSLAKLDGVVLGLQVGRTSSAA
jgi:hypothetical protein